MPAPAKTPEFQIELLNDIWLCMSLAASILSYKALGFFTTKVKEMKLLKTKG